MAEPANTENSQQKEQYLGGSNDLLRALFPDAELKENVENLLVGGRADIELMQKHLESKFYERFANDGKRLDEIHQKQRKQIQQSWGRDFAQKLGIPEDELKSESVVDSVVKFIERQKEAHAKQLTLSADEKTKAILQELEIKNKTAEDRIRELETIVIPKEREIAKQQIAQHAVDERITAVLERMGNDLTVKPKLIAREVKEFVNNNPQYEVKYVDNEIRIFSRGSSYEPNGLTLDGLIREFLEKEEIVRKNNAHQSQNIPPRQAAMNANTGTPQKTNPRLEQARQMVMNQKPHKR